MAMLPILLRAVIFYSQYRMQVSLQFRIVGPIGAHLKHQVRNHMAIDRAVSTRET